MKSQNSFKGQWLADKDSFREACRSIAAELRENKHPVAFKINANYCSHIGNDIRNKATAEAFYNYISEHYSTLLILFNHFLTNDTIGLPIVHNFGNITASAGTLRFIKVLGDIIEMDMVHPKTIIEIGSGYGGQCKIIKDMLKHARYTLVDIPESLEVAKAYLDIFNVRATFVSSEALEVAESYDLVISDYCLGELNYAGIDFYFDQIINRCKSAYFTINDSAQGAYVLDRTMDTFKTVTKVPETPRTSRHNNFIIQCKN